MIPLSRLLNPSSFLVDNYALKSIWGQTVRLPAPPKVSLPSSDEQVWNVERETNHPDPGGRPVVDSVPIVQRRPQPCPPLGRSLSVGETARQPGWRQVERRAIPGHNIGHLREDSGIGGTVAVSGSGRLPGGVVTLGGISSALLHEAPNISGGRLASLGAGTNYIPRSVLTEC